MFLTVFLIVAVILVLWFFFGYFCFYLACCQYRKADRSDVCGGGSIPDSAEQALRVSQVWLDSTPAEQINIKAIDGISLYGELKEQKSPKGTVIFFHGYHSSCRRDIVIQAHAAYLDGYSVLLVTQRGHGKSGGKYITFGVKERDDVLLWARYAAKRFGGTPIALMGLSMGGASVLFAADTPLPSCVKCIIDDCGFSSPREITAHIIFRKRFIVPYPTLFFMDIWSRLLADFSFFSTSVSKSLKKNTRPLLIIHGKLDRFVPTEMSYKTALIQKELTELIIVPRAKHAQAIYYDTDGYLESFLRFLDKNM